MAFGSDSFPLGPAGGFPKQRVVSAGNEIAPPELMQELYDSQNHAKLPVRERDYHSSVSKVNKMKMGKKHRNAEMDSEDIKWLGRKRPGVSGVGFFGMRNELGDVEQKFQEDMASMRRRHRTKF
jgi:hypothetical protein